MTTDGHALRVVMGMSEQPKEETERPERRLIGSKLSAQHVLERGEEIEPGVYRIEYEDGATVVCEFAYAIITEAKQ
jgi:hypothetical protein